MRLYVDLDLRQVVTGPGVKVPLSSLFFSRGDEETLEIQFTRGGAVVEEGEVRGQETLAVPRGLRRNVFARRVNAR